MANYSLVINSKFKPFTYDELMKPVHDSTAAHQEVEAAYGALDTQASKWEHMANQATDEKAYTMYKTYADDLRAQANNLARNGLNALSRKDLLTMQRRYAQEITPIENAYTRRAALADEQRKLSQQDISLRFQRDAATMSLDDFIDNPMLDYGKSYSGAALEKQAGEAAASLAKGLREYAVTGTSDPYTNAFVQKYGYTPERITKFLSDFENPNSPNHDEALAQILNSVIDTSEVRSWNDEAALTEAYEWASRGLLKAIGESKVNPMENFKARTDYSIAAKARAAGNGSGDPDTPSYPPIDKRPIFGKKDMLKQRKMVSDYSQYFTTDEKGNTVLTDEGRKYLDGSIGARNTIKWKYAEFQNALKKIGIETAGKTNEEIGALWQQYVDKYDLDKMDKDAIEFPEYGYAVDASMAEDVKKLVVGAAGRQSDGMLTTVDFSSKDKEYISTGNIKTDDLTDYDPIDIGYGRYGFNITFALKDGKEAKRGQDSVITVKLPILNFRADQYSKQILNEMQDIEEAYPTATDKEKVKFEMEYAAREAQLYNNIAMSLRTNTTKSYTTE